MEANISPVIIPMWLSGMTLDSKLQRVTKVNSIFKLGFDRLMPEGRSFPYKFIPRLGASLRISMGSPLSPEDFKAVIRSRFGGSSDDLFQEDIGGWLSERRIRNFIRKDRNIDLEMQKIRSEVTAVAHHAVEHLGRQVTGDLLGGD